MTREEEDRFVEQWKDEIDPEGAEVVEIMIARAMEKMEEKWKEANEPKEKIRWAIRWLGELKRELEQELQEGDKLRAENRELRESLDVERQRTASLLKELEAARKVSERKKSPTWAWVGPGDKGSANNTAKGLRVAVTQAALEGIALDSRASHVAEFNRIARYGGAPREVTLRCSAELEPNERHLWHVLEVKGSKDEWVVYDSMNERQHLNHLRSVGAAFGMNLEVRKTAGDGEGKKWIIPSVKDREPLELPMPATKDHGRP